MTCWRLHDILGISFPVHPKPIFPDVEIGSLWLSEPFPIPALIFLPWLGPLGSDAIFCRPTMNITGLAAPSLLLTTRYLLVFCQPGMSLPRLEGDLWSVFRMGRTVGSGFRKIFVF